MTEDDVRAELSAAVQQAGGVRSWSRQYCVSFGYVAKVLRGEAAPGGKILHALGLERVQCTEYRRKEEANNAGS